MMQDYEIDLCDTFILEYLLKKIQEELNRRKEKEKENGLFNCKM